MGKILSDLVHVDGIPFPIKNNGRVIWILVQKWLIHMTSGKKFFYMYTNARMYAYTYVYIHVLTYAFTYVCIYMRVWVTIRSTFATHHALSHSHSCWRAHTPSLSPSLTHLPPLGRTNGQRQHTQKETTRTSERLASDWVWRLRHGTSEFAPIMPSGVLFLNAIFEVHTHIMPTHIHAHVYVHTLSRIHTFTRVCIMPRVRGIHSTHMHKYTQTKTHTHTHPPTRLSGTRRNLNECLGEWRLAAATSSLFLRFTCMSSRTATQCNTHCNTL